MGPQPYRPTPVPRLHLEITKCSFFIYAGETGLNGRANSREGVEHHRGGVGGPPPNAASVVLAGAEAATLVLRPGLGDTAGWRDRERAGKGPPISAAACRERPSPAAARDATRRGRDRGDAQAASRVGARRHAGLDERRRPRQGAGAAATPEAGTGASAMAARRATAGPTARPATVAPRVPGAAVGTMAAAPTPMTCGTGSGPARVTAAPGLGTTARPPAETTWRRSASGPAAAASLYRRTAAGRRGTVGGTGPARSFPPPRPRQAGEERPRGRSSERHTRQGDEPCAWDGSRSWPRSAPSPPPGPRRERRPGDRQGRAWRRPRRRSPSAGPSAPPRAARAAGPGTSAGRHDRRPDGRGRGRGDARDPHRRRLREGAGDHQPRRRAGRAWRGG